MKLSVLIRFLFSAWPFINLITFETANKIIEFFSFVIKASYYNILVAIVATEPMHTQYFLSLK